MASGSKDLRQTFDNTLVARHPTHAVTLVENYDSQPLQAMESVVEAWFKPLAYALILLRSDGYPSVFYADYFGARYNDTGDNGNTYDVVLESHQALLDSLMSVRRDFAYGAQHDYFDAANCIGWTRAGDESHPGGIAVLMSNGDAGSKQMKLPISGAAYRDVTGHITDVVTTDADGSAEFRCPAGSLSIWTLAEAQSPDHEPDHEITAAPIPHSARAAAR